MTTTVNKVHRKNGLLHNRNGPAKIDADGTQHWYIHGKRHRDNDLPAIVSSRGTQRWFKHGKRHRDNDLPAVVTPYVKHWYTRDKLHRTNGPAAIDTGQNLWFVEGCACLSNEDFRLRANISAEELCMLVLKYGDIK